MADETSPSERLRQAREEALLTQREAADLLGVTEKTISRWETGSPVKQKDVRAALETYREHAAATNSPDKKVLRGTSGDSDETWSPNPALRSLIPAKAYETALDYCRRLERAGVTAHLIEEAERLMIDGQYAQMNRRLGQDLGEAGWVRLVDATFEIIREVLGSQGTVV